MAGKITLTSTKQEAVEVGDTEGHILSLNVMEGTRQSTGPEPFIDGDVFLVVNSDNYYPPELLAELRRQPPPALPAQPG